MTGMNSSNCSNEVGVVVIGRNEGQRLVECLASVVAQAGNIVYVDSGSTDDSVAAAEEIGASVVRLNLAQPFTAARARNEGFAALMKIKPDSQFVQFIDGDCELVLGWLDAGVAFLSRRSDVAVVCGRRRERFSNASLYNRLCDVEWDTPIGATNACGGDCLVRVSAFEAVNGFRSQLIAGEEPELCVRLRESGWKIWRLDEEMSRHDAAIVLFRQWWVRVVRSGHAYAEVFWLHRRSPYGIYRREVTRAVVWGGLMPLAIVLGSLFQAPFIAGTLIYPFQIGRIALHRGVALAGSWEYGLLITLGKFAELQGVLKFLWRRAWGRQAELIEYKKKM
jgi:glycosyltransferase involved in cell wall biosynthesis